MTRKTRSTPHKFGGDWTTQKLAVLQKYLVSYTTALQDKPTAEEPFQKAYIDAFAGSGYRTRKTDVPTDQASLLGMPDLATDESQDLLEGSAKIALQTAPRFDKYIFIDRNTSRCTQLEELKVEYPHLAGDIVIRRDEANTQIQQMCSRNWSGHRAVLFLDPYGMQVEWATIEAVAHTKAIDLWLLFPLGIGVNRLLTKSGDIPEAWRRRLTLLLGTADWYDAFYKANREAGLFGDDHDTVVKASTETIGRYFNDRLETIFAGVAETPGVLRNSTRSPLYLLCFAVGNERGRDVALRIANHLLKDLR